VEHLRNHAAPALVIDRVVVNVDDNTAVDPARSSRQLGTYSRYVDTYERRGDDGSASMPASGRCTPTSDPTACAETGSLLS
jgi:hypothetical protein